jgi:tetratricopeptide (TPR) repeat protein
MNCFRWIHFSDLHIGSTHDALWPSFKTQLLNDLDRITDNVDGPIQAVIFSGDLVYSGEKQQFEALERALTDIWERLEHIFGYAPLLIPVPGNHDLVRPSRTSSVVKALKAWDADEEIRSTFWNEPDSEYRGVINTSFANYMEWLRNTKIPKPEFHFGTIPGDFSTKIAVGDATIGFVGLNSAFLQLMHGDYHGRLHVDVNQLNAVCGGDPDGWKSNVDFSFLVTHHGPDWLTSSSRIDYESDIYPPWMFYCHFFGHMHEPLNVNESYSYIRERRYRQGASLLGLKNWNGETSRMQGYSYGAIHWSASGGVERLWPRSCVKTQSNYYKIIPDVNYDLDDKGCLERRFELASVRGPVEVPENTHFGENRLSAIVGKGIGGNILSSSEEAGLVKPTLLPTLHPKIEIQHKHIRQIEQAKLESYLRTSRCSWVISDWGLGTDAFIGSVISRLGNGKPLRAYALSCEELIVADDFDAIVHDKYDVSLAQFCEENSSGKSIWILDEINPDFIQSGQLINFESILQTILDFCPELMVVIVSRQHPAQSAYQTVELRSLDLQDVGNYVFNHPRAGMELRDLKTIDRLYMKSGGLPMHLDRIIEMLQVCDLGELSDLDAVTDAESNNREPVPHALKQTVASIADSENQYTKRSYRLLQALSLLPHGESLATIKRLVPNEPFFPRNALELKNAALVQVEDVSAEHLFVSETELGEVLEGKQLCVPRQVRDYVMSLMSDTERNRLVRAAAEMFLGDGYRTGELTEVRKRQKNRGAVLGNDYSLIVNLLQQARNGGRKPAPQSAVRAAVSYASLLRVSSRYKDAVIACEEFMPIVSQAEFDAEYAELRIVYGESLRMQSEGKRAVSVLTEVLEESSGLSNSQKAGIYLELALAYEAEGEKDKAIDSARSVQRFAVKGGCTYFQAESVVLGYVEDISEKAKKLHDLEVRARKKKCIVVANNISLDLARAETNGKAKIELLNRIASDTDIYNRIRAIVDKVLFLVKTSSLGELTLNDKKSLAEAYSYAFFQRMGTLFDRCHRALWVVAKSEGRIDQLVQIFRFSSFIWRVKGDHETESKYFSEIRDIDLGELLVNPVHRLALALKYVEIRKEQEQRGGQAKLHDPVG